MKEITRVINAQITVITKMSDEDTDMMLSSNSDAANDLKTIFKRNLNADDVQVTIQDFVLDKPEQD